MVGDALDPETQFGPLVSADHRDSCAELHRRGASPRAPGCAPAAGCRGSTAPLDGGFFLAPTLLEDRRGATSASREEIFGPVTVLERFERRRRRGRARERGSATASRPASGRATWPGRTGWPLAGGRDRLGQQVVRPARGHADGRRQRQRLRPRAQRRDPARVQRAEGRQRRPGGCAAAPLGRRVAARHRGGTHSTPGMNRKINLHSTQVTCLLSALGDEDRDIRTP